ncbi:MBL fold metallo-hydrolase [Roseivivax isoporae]|uniref:Metallo-beta-lactamase n=1 Tax=Roseivivax isoporae LMG 25204 TaxID=1449351 RepID=X7F570_9RHOB|nr:MBL fold metallo-hydrolase [Roseivivax isoporae]ETX27246.1 metallo-beta-lactamase [Roseivivax isoporae LMG 25204]
MFTRRSFLHAGSGTVAGMLLGLPAIAERALGTGRLRTVSDGHLVLPESFVLGDLPEEEARAILAARGLQAGSLETPCNLALWEDGTRRVLFDAGSGGSFMPSAGRLADSLAALDLAPGDITHVIFTHGHPDHLWGVLDDFDEPLFVNARHVMGAEEAAYWRDPATLDALDPARQSFAAGASRRLEVLGAGLDLAGDGDEVAPGITFTALNGHTPGHMGARVASGGESALIVGDAIGNGHLALARPDWPNPADHEPDVGIETRMALLATLAESGETMVGFHLPGGGIGTIAADGDGYAFTPAG